MMMMMMMMKKKKAVALAIYLIVALAALEEAIPAAESVTCSATELRPCEEAILSPQPQQPSQECCSKVRDQSSCLCSFLNDPNLRRYANGNARYVATACGVTIPTC